MERSIFVYLAIGIGCALLALDGTACLVHVPHTCLVNTSNSIVLVLVGGVTLVPVGLSLAAAYLDHRDECRGETLRLLRRDGETELPRRVNIYLYCSHSLSAWGDRMWQFAIPILFMEVFVDTLLPSACFSLAMYAACIVALPSVGNVLDVTNRWKVMKVAIVAENAMIVLSSIALGLMLLVTNADGVHKPIWTWKMTLLFITTLIGGGIGQILNDAQTLAIERDWVVVIAGEDPTALASFNTIMRRIDLGCKILAPLGFGIIMDFAGEDPTTRAAIGAVTVAIWNLISTPLEYYMTKDVYKLVPELAIKEPEKHSSDGEVDASSSRTESSTFARYLQQWRSYVKHPIFLISFAFCSLYMTVLDGGALNTAYLKWRGVPDSILGSSRGVGAVFGLLGTVLFPWLRNVLGRVERVAVLSVWLFWLCLVPAVVAFMIVGESRTSDYAILGCMVVSRAWLWSTDLAETQVMQEWISPSRRGTINAMQTATYQFFYILIQCAGIVFSDPRQFEALVVFSIVTVFASAVGMSVWDLRYGRKRAQFVSPPASAKGRYKV